MKLKCPISSVTYHTDSGYGSSVAIHPALKVDRKYLLANLNRFLSGQLGDPDSVDYYLYSLAWIKELGVDFKSPINREAAIPFITNSIQQLISLTLAMDKYPRSEFPSFVVTEADADLSSLPNWCNTISDCITDLKRSATEFRKEKQLVRIESVLTRIVNSMVNRDINRAAKFIAEWAAISGDFPNSETPTVNGTIPLSTYWKQIITLSFTDSNIELMKLSVSVKDMDELIEHCEFNIQHGSTHAAILMKRLRDTRALLDEMLTLPAYVQRATNSQLKSKPQRNQFRTTLEYIRALSAWQIEVTATRTFEIEADEL